MEHPDSSRKLTRACQAADRVAGAKHRYFFLDSLTGGVTSIHAKTDTQLIVAVAGCASTHSHLAIVSASQEV